MKKTLAMVGYAGLVGLTPLLAQAYAGEGAASSAPAAEPDRGLQEIVVTARRREEFLTEVPVSITAMTSDYIAKQNIQTFADYATKLPNVSFQYGGDRNTDSVGINGGRATVIRGVSGTLTTAYYIDDTPIPSTVSPLASDLERIEVLKGPQGTLFGSASMGGNVRFITKKPDFSGTSGQVGLQGGKTKLGDGADFGGNASGNFVLSDRVALRASAQYLHEAGFISHSFPDGTGGLATKRGDGESDIVAGAVALRTKFTDAFEGTLSVTGQYSKMKGWPAAYTNIPSNYPVSYTLDRANDINQSFDEKWVLGAWSMNYHGEGFDIVSSTSYFNQKANQVEDNSEGTTQFFLGVFGVDFQNTPVAISGHVTNTRLTHETRVSADKLGIPGLSGTVGVYFQRERLKVAVDPMIVAGLGAAFGWPDDVLAVYTERRQRKDKALFGELNYEFLPRLTATIGVRKYQIDRTLYPDDYGGLFFTGLGLPLRENSAKGSVPKYSLSYKFGDHGNVYATASKGFRSGGPNEAYPAVCDQSIRDIGLDPANVREYQPDSIWNYELGAKNRFKDGRLSVSAAVFQMDWTKIQQRATLGCTFTLNYNAGEARIRGTEFEVAGKPFESVDLTFQAGFGYLQAKLTDAGGSQVLAAGSELLYTPRISGSLSGYYTTPISDSRNLFLQADYSHTGSVRLQEDPVGIGELRRPALDFVNARAGINFGKSEVSLYVRNLFDKRLNLGDIYSSAFPRTDGPNGRLPMAAVSRPRQIGVQYRVDF